MEDKHMKNIKLKTITILIMLSLIFIVLLGYSEGLSTKGITIYVAGDDNHPPYEFLDDNGIYRGFNVDIMRAIAIEKGIDIKFMPMSWHEAMEALNNGDVDLIQGMSRTSGRENEYLFLTPTIKNSQVIFVRSDNKIVSNLEDLSGFKVAFQDKDVNEERLKEVAGLELLPKINQKEGMFALINGEAEAFVGNRETGLYNLQKNEKIDLVKIVGEPMSVVKYGPVTNKNNAKVAELINEGLKEINDNGTYDKIYKKWFGEEYIEKKNIVKMYIKQIFFIALIILIIFIIMYFWNKQLSKEVNKRTTELQEANKKLVSNRNQIHNLAYYDPVTGLPNRLFFIEAFEEMAEEKKGENFKIAILYLDLDRFKDINDSLGHDIGDKVLNIVGIRLESILREGDILARFGGDEFLILMKDLNYKSEVIDFANEIIKHIQKPFSIYGVNHFLTCSIGISIYPEGGSDINTLIKNADMSMYKAKEKGRNTYCIYSKKLSEIEIDKILLLNQLREAKENNEFVLYYQPKIHVETENILGMEALIRWDNPTKGLLGPNNFIPLAEETDVILSIGEWVIEEACRQNKYWIEYYDKPIRVSVNISARQFQQRNFLNIVESALKCKNLDPKYLELEITESTAVINMDYTMYTLKKLKELGVYISIDDFGTGYSSLSYLKEMSVDELKIDRSFIKDINVDEKTESIVKSTINLAHELGLKVTAEGAETKEQVEFLKKYKCDHIQGYYYSKPVPPREFENLFL